MQKTFANLPDSINQAISDILTHHESSQWVKRAEILHKRYMSCSKKDNGYLSDFTDVLAYLALRVPATYAQIYGALEATAELLPSWHPKTVLDIGSGPGTGVWTARSIWPSITQALCIDQDSHILSLGRQLSQQALNQPIVLWQQQKLPGQLKMTRTYDLIIIANVLNEMSVSDSEQLLGMAYNYCTGIMVVIEPGTPFGSNIVELTAKKFSRNSILLAPYIQNSFVQKKDYWLHFSKRFTRPEYERRVRHHMRDDSLAASDWEEAKYSYVAISKLPTQQQAWGRCIGPVRKQKGFVEVTVLTKNEILHIKVLQRHKKEYSIAKNLRWGDLILTQNDIVYQEEK